MESKRKITQIIATLICNLNLKGLFTGSLFHGPVKGICVPGLNCYSCPAATGSCPLGALQQTITTLNRKVNLYVVGLIGLYSCLCGRLICGWLCPFGLVQELLYKIPLPKYESDLKRFRWLKYAILAIFVVLIPLVVMIDKGIGIPAFCKFICPQGTIGGTLLVAANEKYRDLIGGMFYFKWVILALIILASIVLFRPFCRLLCPLGALYGLFNSIALIHIRPEPGKCTDCGACTKACPVKLTPKTNCNSAECIRCGKCVSACPDDALHFSVGRHAEKN